MSRRLGQHFLVRRSVINRIVRALHLSATDRVLEIGPGRGALTAALSPRVEKLLAVEKDAALHDWLKGRFASHPGILLMRGDFLELAWSTVQETLGGGFKVVSNLPYEAATAILLKILREFPPSTELVLMFQKEVAERLLARPHTKDFGSLTVWTQIQAKVRPLFDVPPAAFIPPPKIHSTVLWFRLRDRPLVAPERFPNFERLLKAGFAHRRKMLRQNLRAFFQGETAEAIENRLREIEANPQARAEELSVEQWVRIFTEPRYPPRR
ncbi:MAG: 16S rRNA (adenine(1518)-N(6)/adenine(1519)-N(6))-dimethyltransferase RsmA [Candidatus Binatia bacterium]